MAVDWFAEATPPAWGGRALAGMRAELVHLHVHTQFSFLASTVKVGALVDRVVAHGMKAVALTDHANMFGAIRHYTKCREAGIQPILGAELNVTRPEGRGVVDHLVVLAATNEGYANLVRLVSRSHVSSACDSAPSVTLDDVRARAKGLIGLSGCLGGVAAQRVLEQGPDHGEKVLVELGWGDDYLPQVNLSGKRREDVPDVLLFPDAFVVVMHGH